MKITFEVPDDTCAVILSFLYGDVTGVTLASIKAGNDELEDGVVIKREAHNDI